MEKLQKSPAGPFSGFFMEAAHAAISPHLPASPHETLDYIPPSFSRGRNAFLLQDAAQNIKLSERL